MAAQTHVAVSAHGVGTLRPNGVPAASEEDAAQVCDDIVRCFS